MIELTADAPLYTDNFTKELELEALENCISALTYEALLLPSSTFSSNVRAIFWLLDMPQTVSAYSQGYGAAIMMTFVNQYLNDKGSVDKDLESAWESHRKQNSPVYDVFPSILEKQKNVQVALESQLAFAVVAIWTALEALAKDVWVGAVNSFPDPLARHALNAQNEGDRASEPKSIKSSWIAKYGFDLRDCMGTLLAEDEAKFKFSSPDQIIKAYKASFKESEEISRMWTEAKKELNLLNLSRNLVAHRAGIVDERFNRQAKLALPVGKRLPLNTKNVHQFLNVAVMAGCELLTSCEAGLSDC